MHWLLLPLAAVLGLAAFEDETSEAHPLYYWLFFTVGVFCLLWTFMALGGGSDGDESSAIRPVDQDAGAPQDAPPAAGP